jgi:death on curing protein
LPENVNWLTTPLVLAVHEAQLAEHGGASGIRDAGLLESALARPRNAASYADADVISLAALYALGIIRNHPFIDGNKRVATVLLETFLELHGYTLAASDAELLAQIMALAASELSDEAFTAWVRDRGHRT